MKTYTDEQIAQIFGHKTSGVQKYLEESGESTDWQDELFEAARNEMAEILDGIFGPNFKGERPSRKEILNILKEAADGAMSEDWD